jgi:predicted HNH restriction endonuclease
MYSNTDYDRPEWKKRSREYKKTHRVCVKCSKSMDDYRGKLYFHVHHIVYPKYSKAIPKPVYIWDSPDEDLCLLCKVCHDQLHYNDRVATEEEQRNNLEQSSRDMEDYFNDI